MQLAQSFFFFFQRDTTWLCHPSLSVLSPVFLLCHLCGHSEYPHQDQVINPDRAGLAAFPCTPGSVRSVVQALLLATIPQTTRSLPHQPSSVLYMPSPDLGAFCIALLGHRGIPCSWDTTSLSPRLPAHWAPLSWASTPTLPSVKPA